MAVALSGDLSFAHTIAVLEQTRPQVESGQGPVELDLSAVRRVDSAGIALLLELARAARKAGREFKVTGAPEQLRRLAEFFGLTSLLALS